MRHAPATVIIRGGRLSTAEAAALQGVLEREFGCAVFAAEDESEAVETGRGVFFDAIVFDPAAADGPVPEIGRVAVHYDGDPVAAAENVLRHSDPRRTAGA